MNHTSLVYADTGVDTALAESALDALLPAIKQSFALRPEFGSPKLRLGYFANVLDLGSLDLAISTDGVGTKALVAQWMDKYDTIGIDCVAMNANDIICVGAEPIAMTDYLAVEVPDKCVFEALGIGLLRGAEQAHISIPGGEVAQIPEMIRGTEDGKGFDLVGTCVGVVPKGGMVVGQRIEPGDVVVGLSSSGIHSNGLSLARTVLVKQHGLSVTDYVPEFGRTLGEELLEPTKIYVDFALDVLRSGLDVKALVHITSDGFLNLLRVKAPASYILNDLPEPHPVFRLIAEYGAVSDEEMFRVFNMGIGFCAVVPQQSADTVVRIAAKHGYPSQVIGDVTARRERYVDIPSKGIRGRDGAFRRM